MREAQGRHAEELARLRLEAATTLKAAAPPTSTADLDRLKRELEEQKQKNNVREFFYEVELRLYLFDNFLETLPT